MRKGTGPKWRKVGGEEERGRGEVEVKVEVKVEAEARWGRRGRWRLKTEWKGSFAIILASCDYPK